MPSRTWVDRPADLEAVLMGAVEQARAAVVEFSGEDTVGEYLGASFDDLDAATHRFLANLPGYRGWQWAVVVAAHPRCRPLHRQRGGSGAGADGAAGAEMGAVAGPVRPGDLSPGDLLAPPSNDPRLVPGYSASGDPQVDETAVELGLGRRQVLSELGRAGPRSAGTTGSTGGDRRWRAPPGGCAAIAGSTCRWPDRSGSMFGVCANELSADGHVVDSEYGCGAHSDTPRRREPVRRFMTRTTTAFSTSPSLPTSFPRRP